MNTKQKSRHLTEGALIAALYVLLTLFSGAFGLSNGAVQLRLSEALTVLPLFTRAALPGLTAGCALANLLTGCGLWDIVLGTLATFLGAVGTGLCRKMPLLSPLFPIGFNCLIIPPVLQWVYGMKQGYFYLLATVGTGEILSCGALGLMVYAAVKKIKIAD